MNPSSNVGETLKYDYKPKVSGFYEWTNAVQTTTIPTSFTGSEQMITFDLASGARSINWSSFRIAMQLRLRQGTGASDTYTYYFRTNPYISRAVLRSKVGRFALDLTEVPAFSNTIPYRKKKNYLDFNGLEVFGDKGNANTAAREIAGNYSMQIDKVVRGATLAQVAASETLANLVYSYPLGDVLGGIFEKFKDIPLTTGFFLDLYLTSLSEVVYQINNANAYNGGTASAAFTVGNAALPSLSILNITCSFKQQADDQINVGLQSFLSSGGMLTVPFDYIQCQSQTTTSTANHNISQPITTIIGDKLKTVYYMVGQQRDTTNADYYGLRYSSSAISNNVFINQITVKLNNRVIGIYNISQGDHYQYEYGFPSVSDREFIALQGQAGTSVNRGLCYVNNHWFLPIHLENLTDDEDAENSNTGLPIRSDTNITFQLTLEAVAGNVPQITLVHRVYMIGTKYMEISGKGIEILP